MGRSLASETFLQFSHRVGGPMRASPPESLSHSVPPLSTEEAAHSLYEETGPVGLEGKVGIIDS